jgi:hypothetical protein
MFSLSVGIPKHRLAKENPQPLASILSLVLKDLQKSPNLGTRDFGPIVAGSQYFLRRVTVAFAYGRLELVHQVRGWCGPSQSWRFWKARAKAVSRLKRVERATPQARCLVPTRRRIKSTNRHDQRVKCPRNPQSLTITCRASSIFPGPFGSVPTIHLPFPADTYRNAV